MLLLALASPAHGAHRSACGTHVAHPRRRASRGRLPPPPRLPLAAPVALPPQQSTACPHMACCWYTPPRNTGAGTCLSFPNTEWEGAGFLSEIESSSDYDSAAGGQVPASRTIHSCLCWSELS